VKVWNLLEQFFKRNGMWLLEKIFARRVIRPTHVNFGKIHRILVVRQHDQLGDFLLSTPVFRALREHFPESHITALVRRYVAPVVENNPYVDDVLVFEEVGTRWTPRRLKDLWKGLRSDYDLAVVINTVSHSFTSDLLAHFSGARYVLGSEHLIFPGCRRNFFYNLIAPYWSGSRHQSERSLDIVRHLGIDTENRSELMALTEEEVRWAREFLAEHGVGENDLLISCHVGAGKLANRWPVESFAEAANRLHQNMQAHILVAWGAEEDELGEQFLDLVNFEPIRAYGFSLRQLAALISCSNLYLGNDTGILHVAAAVDVPVVGVFGPTDPSVWLPIGEKFTAIRGEDGRCESVAVEAVVQRAQELIDLYTELPVMTEVDAVVESVQPPAEEEEAEEFDISEEVLENYLELLEKFEKGEQSGSVA
jgi:ADP-heptose:LPS heptosyltransferase